MMQGNDIERKAFHTDVDPANFKNITRYKVVSNLQGQLQQDSIHIKRGTS